MEKYKKLEETAPEYLDEIKYFKEVYNDFLGVYNRTGGNPPFFNESIKANLQDKYHKKVKELDLRIDAFKETVLNYVSPREDTELLFLLVEEEALCMPGERSLENFKKTYRQIIEAIDRLSRKGGPDFHFRAWQQLELGYEIFADLRRARYKLMAIGTIREQANESNFVDELKPINKRFEINPWQEKVNTFLEDWECKKEYKPFYLKYLPRWEKKFGNQADKGSVQKYSKPIINEIKKNIIEADIPGSTAIGNSVEKWITSDARTEKYPVLWCSM